MVGTLEAKKLKVLFFTTEDWYFWSHRLLLARAVRDSGFDVVVVTRVNQHTDRIKQEGFNLIPIKLERNNKNPFHGLWIIFKLVQIYRRERPDLIHHVAMMPILYGSWAAKIAGVSTVVNAFTGLGYLFAERGVGNRFLRRCFCLAYRGTLSLEHVTAIFQNPDDIALFSRETGIPVSSDIALIRGSGVDLARFVPTPEPAGPPLVVFASRMLWDKGVGEFVDAAHRLRKNGVMGRFVLVGESDRDNPTAVPSGQLKAWAKQGLVEWWGQKDDMPSVFSQSHVVCLPSYREGVSKVLIEAAACGRAIVTTDAPGCREIVRHGENGFLVPVRDTEALARALQTLIENPGLRAKMGARSREIAVTEFSSEQVARETLAVYRQLLGKRSSSNGVRCGEKTNLG